MKSAVYGRVSTDDQVKNYSIASQLEAMRMFAIEHNLDVVKEFVDEGVSGSVLDRPALKQLREFVGEKKLDAVIVYDPDRLSRKLVHLMVLADEFERHGVQLYFITQSMGQTPEDKMLFGMKGLFAEYERVKLLERTMRGKLRRASQDGKQPGGRSLYGYDLPDGRHMVNGYCDRDSCDVYWYSIDIHRMAYWLLSYRFSFILVPVGKYNDHRDEYAFRKTKNIS